MGEFANALHQVPEAGALWVTFLITRAAVLLYLHQLVEAEGNGKAQGYHNIQLCFNRCTQLPRCQPYKHHHRVNHQNKQGRTKMTESHIYKKMMQMGLVGPERRLASHHSQRHHSQCVEHGDAQHCKRERPQAFERRPNTLCIKNGRRAAITISVRH